MGYIDMKRPKPKKQPMTKARIEAADTWYEKYPYGLRLDLGKEEIDKLKLDVDDYEPEDIIELTVKAKVIRVSKSKDMNDMNGKQTERQNLDLQVTHINMGENKIKTMREAVKLRMAK